MDPMERNQAIMCLHSDLPKQNMSKMPDSKCQNQMFIIKTSTYILYSYVQTHLSSVVFWLSLNLYFAIIFGLSEHVWHSFELH